MSSDSSSSSSASKSGQNKKRTQPSKVTLSSIRRDAAAEKQQQAAAASAVPKRARVTSEMVEKVTSAMRATNDKFAPPTQVAARYAHTDSVRQFLSKTNVDSSNSEEAAAIVSSHGAVDQSLSRIDDLISGAQNQEASVRVQRSAAAAGDNRQNPRTPAGALQSPADDLWTIDKLTERVLGLDNIDGLGGELLEQPYQVNGLSRDIVNPDYVALQDARVALEARLCALRDERERLKVIRAHNVWGPSTTPEEDLRLATAVYEPIERLQLLKPASEVRALNDRWRNLFGSALIRIYRDFEVATGQSLLAANGGDEARAANVLALYRERVLNPVLNGYVEQLQTSTYEDMPLTSEVLQMYFDRFITVVLRAMLLERQALGEEALLRLREQQLEQARRNYAFTFTRVVNELQGAAANVHALERVDIEEEASQGRFAGSRLEDEERVVNEYLRQALFIHATRDYVQWLEKWLASVRGLAPEIDDATVDQLRASVRAMVEGREDLTKKQQQATGRVLPPYAPPSEAQLIEGYAQLVVGDVALERAKVLLSSEEEEDQLREHVQRVLAGVGEAELPQDTLLHPRIDRFEVLEQSRQLFDQQIRATHAPAGNLDAQSLQLQRVALDEALFQLQARADLLRGQLLFYAPMLPENTVPHSPGDDASGDGWTPYDLSYPLDVAKTKRAYSQLFGAVARQAANYDAEEMHQRANRMRATLSYGYADRLVQREIMRIDYLLNYVAVPHRAVPLELRLAVNDTQRPLVLEAQLELRDELKLALTLEQRNNDPGRSALERVAPSPELQAAVERLETQRAEAVWFFRPRYGGLEGDEIQPGADEVVIARQVLPAGEPVARLLANANGADTLNLGGQYRCEIQLGGVVYKSRFTANVFIFATCARDKVVYEVGTDGFHSCHWQELPRNLVTHEFLEEVLAQVQGGDAALQELVNGRAEREELVAKKLAPIGADLFMAPWGDNSELSIRLAVNDLNAGLLMPKFHYNAVFGRIFSRLAAQVRNVLTRDGTPERLRKVATESGDLRLVALLAEKVDDDAPLGLAVSQVIVLAQSAALSWSDPELGDRIFTLDGIGSFGADLSLLLGGTDGPLSPVELEKLTKALVMRDAVFGESVFDATQAFSYVPRKSLVPLASIAGSSATNVPLATALHTALKPAVWQNLAAHERRFVHELFARFEAFSIEFRTRAYESERMAERRATGRDFIADYRDENDPDCVALTTPRRPFNQLYDEKIDRELGTMLPEIVQRTARGWTRLKNEVARVDGDHRAAPVRDKFDDILFDHALFNDFRGRADSLARRGVLAINEFAIEPSPVASRRNVEMYVAADEEPHTFGSSRWGTRRKWVGEHSFRTNQPQRYVILITPDGAGGRASIVKRGSAVTNANYDFEGMHAILEALIARYNAVLEDTTQPADARARALRLRFAQVRDVELAFHFLAFLAPAQATRFAVPAAQLLDMGRDYEEGRTRLFTYLRQIAPATAM